MMNGPFQVLAEDGRVRPELEPGLSSDGLRKLYSLMATTRAADLKALKLQRQGRMGTFAPSLGHEACQVGSAFALEPKDWAFPYFRDLGAFLTLGLPLKNYYLYWMGNEEGMRIPAGLNIFTIAVPVGSQIPHAVGCGMALKYRKEQAAALVYFGDGATSEGDFNEALNFAGVFQTPNVFVCINNQYAISTPVRRQTAAPTIAQKASAYGFEGVRADGNDVLGMLALTRKGVTREEAYRVVQENAMKVWAGEKSFEDLLKQDPRIQQWLTNKELADLFNLDHTLKNVDVIFRRVFKKEK